MQAELDKDRPQNMHIILLRSNDYETQFAEAKETVIKIIKEIYRL
jgi:hypothetical protein